MQRTAYGSTWPVGDSGFISNVDRGREAVFRLPRRSELSFAEGHRRRAVLSAQ